MTIVHVHPGHVRGLREGITRNVHEVVGALERADIDARLEQVPVGLSELNRRRTLARLGVEGRRKVKAALEDPSTDLVQYHVGLPMLARFARPKGKAHQPVLAHVWNAVYEPLDEPVGTMLDRAPHRLFNGMIAARYGLKGLDGIIVSSQFQADQLRRLSIEPPIHVVPNGVNTTSFRPADVVERSLARQELKADGDPNILYYGHLSPWKGVETLIMALPTVFASHPEARLILSHTSYGHGGPELRRLIWRLGLERRVIVVEPTDPGTLLAAADVAVLPTASAIGTAMHPNTLLEMMSSGVPVVSTSAGSNAEVVTDGSDGMIVRPNAPGELARALVRVVEDEPLRRRLGRQARRTAVERFDWGVVARGLSGVYERYLPREHAPVPREVPPLRAAS